MQVQTNYDLQPCNTLALYARAGHFARAENDAELLAAIERARLDGLRLLPLGGGSNVVLAGDVDGLVLQLVSRGIERLDEDGAAVTLRVQAGESWHALVAWTLRHELYGLENLALIPGSVGAAPIQNIGAYGVELDSCLVAVHAVTRDTGERVRLEAADCELRYRDSIFKHALREKLVITAVDLRLSRQPRLQLSYPALADALEQRGVAQPTPGDVFDAVVALRQARLPDPAVQPNAGSFFKNPLVSLDHANRLRALYPELPVYPLADGDRCKLAAAWLIEQCGWKGHRQEGVGVHPGHALVLVNYGGNSGAALLRLAEDIAASVAARFDVTLEIEPRVYGGGH